MALAACIPITSPSLLLSTVQHQPQLQPQLRPQPQLQPQLQPQPQDSAITNSSSSAQAAFTRGLSNSKTNSWQGPPEVPSNSKINPQTPSRTKIVFLINFLKVWSRSDRERTVYAIVQVCTEEAGMASIIGFRVFFAKRQFLVRFLMRMMQVPVQQHQRVDLALAENCAGYTSGQHGRHTAQLSRLHFWIAWTAQSTTAQATLLDSMDGTMHN